MACLENGSNSLVDHIKYYAAVRQENALMFAARRAGVKTVGICPVPSLQASAARAKSAIEMQMMCQELLGTVWGKDSWSLSDVSQEMFMAPPSFCFKKGPRIIEVTYDGDENNKNWYTAYNLLYIRGESGWNFATGGADGEGLFYTMNGVRTHYLWFREDAARYSTRGTWQVVDRDQIYQCAVSSTSCDSSRDAVDGADDGADEGNSEGANTGETPLAAQPNTGAGFSSGPGAIRNSQSRVRGSLGANPYPLPLRSGLSLCTPPASPVPSPLSLVLERESEITEAPPSPDSSHNPPPVISDPEGPGTDAQEGFQLFSKAEKTYCLLLSGGANCVKCLRWRLKRYHRGRFKTITTTWWATGNEGFERKGDATILVTFCSWEQRRCFMDIVSIPTGVVSKVVSVSAD